LQQRHAEPIGLAHAGTCLADEILAADCQRKGELLNREGALNATLRESADDLLANAEFGESGSGVSFVKFCVQEGVGDTGFLVDADLAQGRAFLWCVSARTNEGPVVTGFVPDWQSILASVCSRSASALLNLIGDSAFSAKLGSEADAVRAHFLVSASLRDRRLR
jgi:hypothetical protein